MTQDQIRHIPETVSIRALLADRDYYFNFPDFQRGGVWSRPLKNALIETILRGLYLPELVAFRADNHLYVLDGRQRLTTIYDFLDNRLLYRHRAFSALSAEEQDRFLSYQLRFAVLQNYTDALLRNTYRNLQNQVILTYAEKLFSYQSKALAVARQISEHPFFAEVYGGKRERKEPVQAGMYPVTMELSTPPYFTQLESYRLNRLAEGSLDEFIVDVDALVQRIEEKLEACLHLFANVRTRSKVATVMMYQLVCLLEILDIDPFALPAGALTAWFTEREQMLVNRTGSVLVNFTKYAYQRAFWGSHLPELISVLSLSEEKRMKVMQLQHWFLENRQCPQCHQQVEYPRSIWHHGFARQQCVHTSATPPRKEHIPA